jgi:hypothetical protein
MEKCFTRLVHRSSAHCNSAGRRVLIGRAAVRGSLNRDPARHQDHLRGGGNRHVPCRRVATQAGGCPRQLGSSAPLRRGVDGQVQAL